MESREGTGDLEIDAIIGKNHKGAILTINDRVTGQLKMKKLGGKNAYELADIALALLMPQKHLICTVTTDLHADKGRFFSPIG